MRNRVTVRLNLIIFPTTHTKEDQTIIKEKKVEFESLILFIIIYLSCAALTMSTIKNKLYL